MLPAENRLNLGVNAFLAREFLVLKQIRSEELSIRGDHFDRIAFNNEVITAGLAALKKKYKLKLSLEEIDTRFKRIKRSRVKKKAAE